VRRFIAFVAVALSGFGAACGRGVSEDPLIDVTRDARGSGGSGGSGLGGSSASNGGGDDGPDATGGTSGAAPSSGGASRGGHSGSGSNEPRPKPDGAECRNAADCRSGQCTEDVDDVRRCCEDDCDALGGHCDTSGECACKTGRTRLSNGDPCLLVKGEPCTLHGQCASGNCADGVCCDEQCDDVCEQCDASGSCVAAEEDPDVCRAPNLCMGKKLCLSPNGAMCGNGSHCASGACGPTDSGVTICCNEACGGTCETCSPDGTCNDFPERDPRCTVTCAPSTRCVTYVAPPLDACSAHGTCTPCQRIDTRKGIPCGVGRQCDGEGECEVTGRGRVAAGESHTCAIDDDANVVCWGDNRFGQLGASFNLQHVGLDQMPNQVPDRTLDFQSDVVQITAGAQHTCVLFDTGAVRCWGQMYDHPVIGRLLSIFGTPDFEWLPGTTYVDPIGDFGIINPLGTGNVALAEPAEQISAAPEGAAICALLRSGKISCWGHNLFGQLGLGHKEEVSVGTHGEVLKTLDLGERVVEVRCGMANTCARTESGRVHCWGEGMYGRLGNGSGLPSLRPVLVEIGEPAKGLAVGFDHTCVVLSRGAVRCWGNNFQGELGYGHTDAIGDNETPAEAAMDVRGEGVAAGGDVPLDAEIDQVMTFPTRSVPRMVDLNGDGTIDGQIWDSSPTCAVTTRGIVRCWGRNEFGQLGYGHNLPGATEHTPVELGQIRVSDRFVDTGGEVLALADGGRCALRSEMTADGKQAGPLYCWGPNDRGQIGVPWGPAPSLTWKPSRIGPVHWR
jgi:alpha-tubulin suppressor-like RCC1 family protein